MTHLHSTPFRIEDQITAPEWVACLIILHIDYESQTKHVIGTNLLGDLRRACPRKRGPRKREGSSGVNLLQFNIVI